MTKKQKEQRETALAENGSTVCPVCGGSIYQYGTPQYAHRIGNTETNRKKYGAFFIDSAENGRYVCSLACNASVDVGKSKGNIMLVLADILTYEINRFSRGNDD